MPNIFIPDGNNLYWLSRPIAQKRGGAPCIRFITEGCNNPRERAMTEPERFQTVILGSGQGGKLLAWHLGKKGQRTAVVERQWVGGSCPAVACMPSKNEIWSARAR